jgi:hypothetical protein
VNNEVEHWLANRDPDRIIPVLTDGEFGWADGDIVSNAAPPALVGAFADEPRWVDLRFARTEEQLDLKSPTFSAAIADIASPIRGVPKDELESEEVRQHRRTIRTASVGLVILLLLAVIAAVTAIYAIGQTNEVAVQRDAARESEQAAQQSEQAAQQSEQAANEFAHQVLAFSGQLQSSAAPPGSNYVRADQRNIPLPVAESPPTTPRLTFLEVQCTPQQLIDEVVRCSATEYTTFMLHPELPLMAQAWLAYEPFHIRHGFVNPDETPLGSGFPPDFDVEVFITRRQGPPLAEGIFEIDQTYRFTPDYLVRESSQRCGPGYLDQTGPLPCDEFVHEFANGLPPGAYDFWVGWQAPCAAWTTADVCESEELALRLFATQTIDMGFYSADFTGADHFNDQDGAEEFIWPFDPWRSVEQPTDP